MNALTAPAQAIYLAINRARRSLYGRGILRSRQLPRPVVSIGNLSAGGAGKTPAVIALATELVNRGAGVAVLTRGYGRSGKGAGLVDCLDPMIASLRHGLTSAHGVLGGGAPRYGVYTTKSGRIAVAALEPHFEKNLYEHLELPRGSDPSARFLERTAEEWERWADERALPIVAVSDLY